MAWWNRVADVIRRINDRLVGTGGEQPQQYTTVPIPPVSQAPVRIQPSQPSDSGEWPSEPVYEQPTLYGGEPDDAITLYDQNLLPIEYAQDTGEPVSLSPEQWFEETFRSREYLIERYGLDNIDILSFLYDQGYIDDEDWETWRDIYGSMFG